MITPWEIYWVMQLDSIGATLTWIAVLASLALLVCVFLWCVVGDDDELVKQRAQNGLRTSLYVLAATFAIGTFIPSTKTAAAMIVIPAVANNQAIQREAGDLYAIAKDALRELAKPKEAK